MAITKLGHINKNKKGPAYGHLKNSIEYILNDKKTEDGTWIGSNCGTTSHEIYETMIETKKEYGKEWGRLGYHYVLSFSPGECDEKTAYQIGREFCEELLKDYDYVFAVHNDRHHMHVHIIFNSVNRYDGYKYRYENGDWEKKIQPVTDMLCNRYHLSTLKYDPKGEHKNVNHAEYMAEKEGRFCWKDVIRMDIDQAIEEAKAIHDNNPSEDLEVNFFRILHSRGYYTRKGHSDRLDQDYVTYKGPGMNKGRRDYNLGLDYEYDSIVKRLKDVYDKPVIRRMPSAEDLHFISLRPGNRYQIRMLSRIRQAVNPFDYELLSKEQARVRRDMVKIDRLREECDYIFSNDISSEDEIKKRLAEVKKLLRDEKMAAKDAAADITESSFHKENIDSLMKEKRILMRIIRESDVINDIREVPVIDKNKQKNISGRTPDRKEIK